MKALVLTNFKQLHSLLHVQILQNSLPIHNLIKYIYIFFLFLNHFKFVKLIFLFIFFCQIDCECILVTPTVTNILKKLNGGLILYILKF